MHGIKEINWQNAQAKARQILERDPPKEIDGDYLLRQRTLDDYLKAKYGEAK